MASSPKFPKQTSSTTNARRRLAARRRSSERQQRWRDAARVVRASVNAILFADEDRYTKHLIYAALDRVEKLAKSGLSEETLVLNAVRRGCRTASEIEEETGFPIPIIKELCRHLIEKQKLTRVNNHYQLAE